MSLSELRQKDVVSIISGKSLGHVMDIEFSRETGCVTALVVPGGFNLLQSIKGEKTGIAVPWDRIQKIGEDVVLVDIAPEELEGCYQK
ncbi:MAG: YlmC/YmxH family sporulation protein [Eubacteriales bacterium]|nr:YlmC/YmxH family sporulation protein [Eubacteriales bacterium]MDD3881289.1 YlmC/YmxH family sporulation protein [Eubacteriales bacterium]MDD4512207.1 YlmC/YmxH family sporulation protein [Eubacteriales bacterium]